MIRAMPGYGCLAIGRDIEGKKAKASQSPPPTALRQRGLSRTPALEYLHKANVSYQRPKQATHLYPDSAGNQK